MKHGGSSRRRQKMAEREQVSTNVVGRGSQNSGDVSITSTGNNNSNSEELGADLDTDKAFMAGAVVLGAGLALSAL